MASSTTNTPRIQLKDAQTGQWQDITHAVQGFEFAARNASSAFAGLAKTLESFGPITGSFGFDYLVGGELAELERQERLANVWRYAVVLWFVVAIVAVWVSV